VGTVLIHCSLNAFMFQSLALQSDAPFDFAQKPELKPKNRFKNILPCE